MRQAGHPLPLGFCPEGGEGGGGCVRCGDRVEAGIKPEAVIGLQAVLAQYRSEPERQATGLGGQGEGQEIKRKAGLFEKRRLHRRRAQPLQIFRELRQIGTLGRRLPVEIRATDARRFGGFAVFGADQPGLA